MKIALVNSALAAVPAATQAVRRLFPDPELWSLLNDRLQQDVTESANELLPVPVLAADDAALGTIVEAHPAAPMSVVGDLHAPATPSPR